MNLFTKKKMFEIIADLQDGVKALKKEKDEVLAPVWVENMGLFLYLVNLVKDHLQGQEGDYEVCLAVIEDFNAEGQKVIETAPNPEERLIISKEMNRLLKKLQFEIKKAVPEDKKELVFFPYLYAMWDSLESVWKAAVDSGEYDVSVVPIPYYTKKPDGSFDKMHYEGDLYPSEVNIIPWESYHIEERKPHVAYVHNPYDKENLVTSIHPNFYCEKIKPHVGSLVYIPYFLVTGNQVPEHFCLAPVPLQADKIIVESKEVRENYIDSIYAFLKARYPKLKREAIAQKVLALGSPKLDSKRRSKEELMKEMPEEWHSILRKPDGSMKKVVFFNLSIGALLQNQNAMEKWKDSLTVFRQQAEEFVLWWRPHPLLESTMVSMRPGVLQQYRQMIYAYQEEAWGIFDDCTEFHTAVEFCDAYYGDPSSVVVVFNGEKKPVMIQNYAVMNQEETLGKGEK